MTHKTLNRGFGSKTILTVVHFYGTDKRNLALLVRENDACPYITVRDLSEANKDDFDWAWGHYFSDFDDVIEDYRERLSVLL